MDHSEHPKKLPQGGRFIRSFGKYPVAAYITLGVVLHFIRFNNATNIYMHQFAQFDKERKQELEQFLAQGVRPD